MTVFRISFLLVLALAFSACDTLTEPDEDVIPDPEPEMVSLQIVMDKIYVEGDCDVAGINNEGDFVFDVTEDVRASTSYVRSVYSKKLSKNKGSIINLSSTPRMYDILDDRVGFVTIEFEATELDNLGGNDFPDTDMNGRTKRVEHSFRNGTWSNLGRKTLRLGSKSSCRVELRYTASVAS